MALYIRKGISWQGPYHIGGPIPVIRDRVVEFQVDGDELLAILAAYKSEEPGV